MGLHLFIKRTIVFIVFSFFIYIGGVILYGEFVPKYFQNNILYEKFGVGFFNTRLKEVKEIKDVDILFLGSSRAYRHYDPRIFSKAGYSSFNLGSSAQTFLQTEILLKRYLDSLSPKYIILDFTPFMVSSDGAEASLDLISNDYNSWDTFKLVIKVRNFKVLNTWIFALYKELLFNSLKEEEDLIKGPNRYIPGGFVERKVKNSELNQKLDVKWLYDKGQWKSFDNILNLIKDSNTELIILHSPRQSSISYDNETKFINFLKKNEIPYYNYMNLNFIKDSIHFYDPSHMNQNGVNLYNEFIIKKHF